MYTHSYQFWNQRLSTVDADLILVNQDLAGFFTSIDQDRFVGAWFMLLDFLRPHMDVSDNEAFSVYPGKSNNPGDIIKGRTFRRLHVTRKITIKDVSRSNQIRTKHANIRPGTEMHPSMSRQPDGKSTVPSLMPHGCVYQRANLVHQLQTNSVQPQLIHSSHPLCWQSSHLWRQAPQRSPTVWSSSGRWLLWKTHNPRNWTRSRVSWLHAGDKTLSIKVRPMFLKFSRLSRHLRPKCCWVASAPDATLSSKEHSRSFASDKVLIN